MADEQLEVDALMAGIMGGGPAMTVGPIAPQPGQLQSYAAGPIVREPTEIELGVAQLRAAEPYLQLANEIQGRKLLTAEAASLGILPKAYAAEEAIKAALWGQNPIDRYSEYVKGQDIAKEFVRQKDLEAGNTLLGVTYPEIAGGLISPLGWATRAKQVPQGAKLLSSLATRGSNVGKAATAGAAGSALQTFLSTPGTVEERAEAATESAKIGALLSGGLGAAGQIIEAAGPALTSFGKAARRSAFGATRADYSKKGGQIITTPEGKETLTQKGLDNVLKKGYAGNSRAPHNQLDALDSNIDLYERSLDTKIAEFEKLTPQVAAPDFKAIRDKIKKGKDYTLPQIRSLEKRLTELEDDLATRGGGSLSFLQEQKKAFGKLYDPKADSAEAIFNRDIYHALKEKIEQHIPDAKAINEEVQSMMIAKHIPARRVMQAGAAVHNKFEALRKAGYTTGGWMSYAISQDPVIGLATTGILNALSSAPVRDWLGRAAGLAGQVAPDVAKITDALAPTLGAIGARPTIVPIPRDATSRESGLQDAAEVDQAELDQLMESIAGQGAVDNKAQDKSHPSKQDISALIAAKPPIIQAMVHAESSGNPNAIGPKTKSGHAQGLMQLLPSTAKALGVTDLLDPQQNIDAGEKYFNQMVTKLGSQELALAAYNWGPGNLKKAMAKVEAKNQKPTWRNLLKYTSVPEETESYVAKVLENLKRG